MIDLEADVFSYVAAKLRSTHSGVWCSGEYIASPAKFPAVTIVEADNRVLESMRTLNIENAVSVMYEVNVYSNKTSGKKAEAKAVMSTADKAFAEIGFTRTFREQVPNLADATIYRIVARYEGIVDKDLWVYQN